MDIEKLNMIHKLLYQLPTNRKVINSNDGNVIINETTNNLSCGLEKINNKKCYNVYVEKYHDKTMIKTLILDFDGDKSKDDVYKASELLSKNNIMNVIVNSTNKGYHLYVLLPKPINFLLTKNKNTNDKIFKNFILNLIGDYNTLDKVNYGLYSNIRLIGSIHPKTNKVLKIEYAYTPYLNNNLKVDYKYYKINNEYFNKSFIKSLSFLEYNKKINNIIKNKYKINNYSKSPVDLREYFNGKSYDGGRSKWCVCPFHDDNHASLHVYEKVAYCEVCGSIPFEDIKKEFNL